MSTGHPLRGGKLRRAWGQGACGKGTPSTPRSAGLLAGGGRSRRWGEAGFKGGDRESPAAPRPSASVQGAGRGRQPPQAAPPLQRSRGVIAGSQAKLPGNKAVAGDGSQWGISESSAVAPQPQPPWEKAPTPGSADLPGLGRRCPKQDIMEGLWEARRATKPEVGTLRSPAPNASAYLRAGLSESVLGLVLWPDPGLSVTCRQDRSASRSRAGGAGPQGDGRASHQEGQRRESAWGLHLDRRC